MSPLTGCLLVSIVLAAIGVGFEAIIKEANPPAPPARPPQPETTNPAAFAETLNALVKKAPQSSSAKAIRKLRDFVRNNHHARPREITSDDAKAISDMLQACRRIRATYDQSGDEKRAKIEYFFGRDSLEGELTFQKAAAMASKLSKRIDEALSETGKK